MVFTSLLSLKCCQELSQKKTMILHIREIWKDCYSESCKQVLIVLSIRGSMLWPLETKFPPIVYFFSFLFQTYLGLDMWEGKPRLWMSATKAMKFYSCTYIQVTSWIQGYSLERFIPKNISSFSHLTNTKKSSSFLSEVLSKNIFACDHWFLHFPIQSSGSHG